MHKPIVSYFRVFINTKNYSTVHHLAYILCSPHKGFVMLLLLLQSALQPLWVLTCSTIVEYSQQEGFYRAPFPAAPQTPNFEDQ